MIAEILFGILLVGAIAAIVYSNLMVVREM